MASAAAVAPAKSHRCEIRVPFESAAHAEAAKRSLDVDKVLTPDRVSKAVVVDGDTLVATVETTDTRMLRAAVNSIFDMTSVAVRTLQEFG